ncbi:MAG: YciI family protein [Bdellovibrionales bacterium]
MYKYMLAYHGGHQPTTREESLAHQTQWKEWIAKHGDIIVNAGTPLMESTLVTSTSVMKEDDPDAMNGFTVIQVESLDKAIEIAKSDPFLMIGGTIRVSRMMEMSQ